ncbi:ABC transporter ATP-binding protein [Aquibacillus salsiterrae]|uniref:ABC transporter ATP-binding protein n=1 Tax=Aquibacillus salsiterrae TaxID=2950439 RepID=A0A9X3WIN4_9BACI|nr:ABC transporter ATP-binding protein [Aquibacillus salsiterrae]MDC3418154.1 ABC transporter ATP-binding protein [Aquibacillus salsiterrae]
MRLDQISLSRDDKQVLHDINMEWKRGETIALIGANGAGKSSLLKVLATLWKPSSGKLIYPDNTIKQWQKNLGVVFPDSFLYDALTAIENLEFYQKLYGGSDRKRLDSLLQAVRLADVATEKVGTFSKGMRQRLSIARALTHYPSYLLLDEPFDGLDVSSRDIVQNLLLQLKEQKTGYILVSHNLDDAMHLCERALLIDNGEITAESRCTQEAFPSFVEQYHSVLKENNHAVY